MYTVLLSFNRFIATKLVYLNNKTCMIRQTLIDLNPIELNCYPFMVILNNGVMEFIMLLMNYLLIYMFQAKRKGVNVMILQMVIRINE